jgi:alpha-galactosidase
VGAVRGIDMNATPVDTSGSGVVHLRSGGTSLLVDLGRGGLPGILHWGADLGDLRPGGPAAAPRAVPVIPLLAEGWLGRPGVAGSRDGRAFAPLFRDAKSTLADDAGVALRTRAVDAVAQLTAEIEIELTPEGIVRVRGSLTNDGETPYRVDVFEAALPVPGEASELLDLSGRWTRERVPQRHGFPIGEWVRASRGGKPGLDHALLLAAGHAGFGFRSGRVWGVHLGWSGSHVLAAERLPTGIRLLRSGELFLPGELVLDPGASYSSPWLYGSWGEGLDELAGRFHRHLRARPGHPVSPRPVLVNTWEAVYFDQSPAALAALAERSAALGAERFVVDDGWFLGRRDATSSLGDWVVDPVVWPDGLEPLARQVKRLGMQFGLWFEPEMISLDSELARAHPDWVFDGGHGPGPSSRHQHVLDLGHDDAYRHVRDRMVDLIGRLGIDVVKWDHNRSLADVGHSADGRPGARTQTLRAYRLMDELRERFPGLEIESCASGGGRVDLGVLERTDRVWASDGIDPHERVDVQRWTGLLLPPELQGCHIGVEESHATGRRSTLDFRAATAFWGHLGLELDLTSVDDETFERLATWVAAHRRWRSLLHSGMVVHADTRAEFRLEGVVAPDRSAALYQFVVLDRPPDWPPGMLRLPGLDPDREYEVVEVVIGDPVPTTQRPAWMDAPARIEGRVLGELGIEAPALDVDRSVLVSVEAAR